jgi:hypothetical protein
MPVELGEGADKEEWWRCPRRPVKDDPRLFIEVSKLWQMREKGFLPYPGSYFEQPAMYVECMSVVDSTVAEADRIRDKASKLKRGEFGDGG